MKGEEGGVFNNITPLADYKLMNRELEERSFTLASCTWYPRLKIYLTVLELEQ